MIATALLLLAGASALVDASPAIEASTTSVLPALLVVHESDGCSAGDGSDALVSEFDGDLAIFRQRIWLTLRESVTQGGVLVTREGRHLRAEVDTVVAPVEPGVPVPACIRPVELVLSVPGLPKDEYEVQFARKDKP
ncbi:MAG: hypothetical protein ABI858_04505 [Pseudoxanthomonas sp.]